MCEELERILFTEIENGSVIVVTTHGIRGPYSVSLFLCEIYEKLRNKFEYGKDERAFFNYEDPHGAWILLKDYFQKTNFLKNTTLQDFEEYRSRYEIALEFKKGESARLYEIFSPVEAIAFKTVSKKIEQYRILDKEAIDNTAFYPDIFHYDSCRTMIDFVFALVHYLVFNNYKITQCNHCGHLFAVKSLKEKYCNRNSPFTEYEDYSCKEAVKQITDTFEKRRKNEYDRLRKRAKEYGVESKHVKIFNDFYTVCEEYKRQIKKGASVELLMEYKAFLYDSSNVRPKYARIKDYLGW